MSPRALLLVLPLSGALLALAYVAVLPHRLLPAEADAAGGLAGLAVPLGRLSSQLGLAGALAAALLAAAGLVGALSGPRTDRRAEPLVLGLGALTAVALLALGRNAGVPYWGVVALAAGVALGAGGLGAPGRGPEEVSMARLLTWAAPLAALLLIGIGTFMEALGQLLALSPTLNAYGRAERLATLYAGGQRLLQLTALAVGAHLAAVAITAVRRPEGGLLGFGSVGAGLLLVLVACLPAATATRRVRDVVQGVERATGQVVPKEVQLPVRRHDGDPAGVPLLVLGEDDSVVLAPLPPKGTRIVSLAIDGRRTFGSASRYLERLIDHGVERMRPVFAYQPAESLASTVHPFWQATFMAPLAPQPLVTLDKGCTVILRRVSAPSPADAGRKETLVTPPAGERWKWVTTRLGQLEILSCRAGKDVVLGL